MSANDNGNGNGDDEEIPGREVAYRLFAAEYDDASFSYAESDEERAPNYVISPTGARLNRIFAVGTLTEVTSVNDEMVRARVVDPTGAFVVYAGQYQPDELAVLEQLQPPAFVAVTGKARTFQPDDSDQVYTSIRPESIATVDADTRDRWVVSAAEQTVERVGTYAGAAELESAEPRDANGDALTDALREAGVESGLAAGIPLAQDHYGTTPDYLEALRDCAIEAVEVVADERDQVSGLSLEPGDSSPDSTASFASLGSHADAALSALESTLESGPDETEQPADAAAATPGGAEAESESGSVSEPDAATAGSAAGTATGTDPEPASEAESEAADAAALETKTESERGSGSETETGMEAETQTETAADSPESGTESDVTAGVDAETEPAVGEPTAEFGEATSDVDDTSLEDETDANSGVATEFDEIPSDADEEDEDDLGDFDAGDSGMYEMDDEEREQLEAEFGAEFTTGAEVEEPGEAEIDVPDADEQPAADGVETESEAAADAASSGEPGAGAATTDEPGDDAAVSAADDEDDDLGAPPESGLAADAEPADEEPDSEGTSVDEADDDDDDAGDAPADAGDEPAEDVDAEDVDLESYVVETMEELDDGDGADRTTLVETVADDTGIPEAEVEDAIQDALMGGQCYEPDDETLKAI